MSKRGEKALEYFEKEEYNCAESILLSFLKEEERDMVRLATPFGGGVGRSRDLCGILTGGVMVIGLYQGRTSPSQVERKIDSYDKAKEYYQWFKESFKVTCDEILPGDFKDYKGICYDNIKKATMYLEELLNV